MGRYRHYAILTVVAILVFFLSMWPTHRLLSRTKKRHVQNATQTIAGAYHDLMALTGAEEQHDRGGIENQCMGCAGKSSQSDADVAL